MNVESNPLGEPAPPGELLTASPLEDQSDVLGRLERIFRPELADQSASPLPATFSGTKVALPQESWKPVIILDPGDMRPGRGDASLESEALSLRVMLKFMRKDGGEGRVKEWSEKSCTMQADPEDGPWVAMILGQKNCLDLDRYFLLLESGTKGGAPKIQDRGGTPVRVVKPEALVLAFVPELLPWSGKEIRLAGQLSFCVDDAVYRIRSSRNGIHNSYFLADGGLLARVERNESMVRLLEFLSTRMWQLDQAGIEALVALNRHNPVPGLVIRCEALCVEQRKLRGQPLIKVETDPGLWGKGPHRTIARIEIDWGIDESLDPGWQRYLEPGNGADTGDGGGAGTAVLWQRDIAWEERVIRWFRSLLGTDVEQSLDDGSGEWIPGRYRAVPEPGPVARLRRMDEQRDIALRGDTDAFLRDWGVRLMEEGFAIALSGASEASARGSVGIHVDRGMDWLDIEAVVEGIRGTGAPGSRARAQRKARQPDAQRREELLAVQELLRHRMVKTNRRILLLSPEDAVKLEKLLDAGLFPGRKTRIHKAQAGILAGLGDPVFGPDLGDVPEISAARSLVERLSNLDTLDLLEPAPGFGATLRGYQRKGYSWLWHMNRAGLGACLADDMGLGKTVMALAFMHRLELEYREANKGRSDSKGWKALLVVPVSTLPNWEAESNRFAPGLRRYIHAGGARVSGSSEEFNRQVDGVELVLVSFATLRIDEGLFRSRTWDVMLIDEAQTIRNPESLVFAAVCSIPSRHRVALTGTPVENSVQDLWAHMEFLNPGMPGTLKHFRSRFGFAIEERRDEQALSTLRRMVHPFMLRRRKEDVALDLPPREEVVVYCDLGPAQRRVYDDIKDAYRLKVDDAIKKKGVERSALTILEALLRLRQACLVPGVINPEWNDAGSTKLDTFCDIVSEIRAGGHKALVFSQFVEVLSRIQAAVGAQGIAHAYLDGQSRNRGESVELFQNDPDCMLFLLSLKAGGVGINLTAADYVILFDPWWNPAVEAQAIDRAYRIGQTRPVLVYRLIARDTVEEKIMDLQSRKKHLAGALVGDDGTMLPGLDPEELLALLG